MLLGMGAGDRLVAVNDHDLDPRVASLPRVGGYADFDWEQLAQIRPDVMIVQAAPANLPAGAREQAVKLGIEFKNVRIDTLADLRRQVIELAQLAGLQPDMTIAAFEEALAKSAGGPSEDVPTMLILLNDELTFAVGQGNYLDDLIEHVGAVNAIPESMTAWPQLDRERLLSLVPQSVVIILPTATDAQILSAEANWRQLNSAVPWEDVTVITDDYAMIPGWRVTEVAIHLRNSLPGNRQ